MDKNKLIPFVCLGVLIIAIAVILFIDVRNKATFSELVISTNNSESTHDNLKLNDLVVVNNVSFWVVSKSKNSLVMHSSEDVSINDKKTSEIQIKMNKTSKVCFENNSCSLFYLQ